MRTRRLFARVIAAFGGLVTLPLSPMRRREARVIACDFLVVPVLIATQKGELLLDASSRSCIRAAWFLHDKEPDTLEWIDGMPDGACFWDVGANVGIYSLYAALNPLVHVLAFEPASSNFAVLNKNIEMNHLSKRILAYCLAFSKETKLDVLNMDSTEAGSAMHGFGTKINQFGEVIDTKFCQGAVGFSMDDFMKMFAPLQPTHIKIDVDGLEADILRGGQETLKKATSMIVEIEGDLDSPRNQEIMALMKELGFTARPKASPDLRNVIFDRC